MKEADLIQSKAASLTTAKLKAEINRVVTAQTLGGARRDLDRYARREAILKSELEIRRTVERQRASEADGADDKDWFPPDPCQKPH
jgi:hypothetical protein